MSQVESLAPRVLESMSSGVLCLDSSGKVVLFNPAAEKLLGRKSSETLGRPFAEVFLMEMEGNDDFNQALLDAVYKRALVNLALVDFTRPDGSVIPLAVTVSYLSEEEGGEARGVVAAFDDVTELNELRAKELELNARLREAVLEADAKSKELESALKSRQRIRTLAMALVLVFFVGAGLYSWFSTPLGDVTRRTVSTIASGDGGEAAQVQTYTVTPRPVSNSISLAGKLEPLQEVMVVCPFQGKVEKKKFFYGQKVDRGQVLLELETSEQEIKLREMRSKYIKALQEYKKVRDWNDSAEMAKARRALDKAEHDLERSRAKLKENTILFDKGIIPKTDLDSATDEVMSNTSGLRAAQEELESVKAKGSRENVDIARMELANAEKQLSLLQDKLALSDIMAPVEGIVIQPVSQKKEPKAIEVGAPLNEGDILLAVGNLEGMTVEAKVDEVDIGKVALGQKVKVTGDAFPGVTLDGRIEHISSQAKSEGGAGSPSFDLVVTIDQLPDDVQDSIRLGMTANLRIVVYENPEALLVPIDAVKRVGGERVVQVIDPDTGQTRNAAVTTGLTTLDSVEITSGLSPGDQIALPPGEPM